LRTPRVGTGDKAPRVGTGDSPAVSALTGELTQRTVPGSKGRLAEEGMANDDASDL